MATLRIVLVACLVFSASGAVLSADAREKQAESAFEKVLQAPEETVARLGASPETKVVKYSSPIQRVVALLQKMKAELEADGKKEAEMYDKMVCWCETNEKEKTKAIADGEAKDKALVGEIEERVAKSAELYTNIEKAKEEIAEIEDMLKNKARPMREGEAGEFREGEKDLVQAIKQLENAITVLSRHHGGSLVQAGSPLVASLRTVFRDLALRYDELQGDSLSKGKGSPLSQRLQLALISVHSETVRTGVDDEALAQTETGVEVAQHQLLGALDAHGSEIPDFFPLPLAESMLAKEAAKIRNGEGAPLLQTGQGAPGAYASYTPQSSVIFGILKQMKEDFETKLSHSQKEEAQAAQAYADMVEAKTKELEALKEKLDMMQDEYYTNKKGLIDAKEDLELTRAQVKADKEFLMNLRLTCQDLDHQWAQRSKTRTAELLAVTEAIAIITEDDAHDLLMKSVTLLQEEATTTTALRRKAAGLLRRALQEPVFDTDDLLKEWNGRSATPHTATSLDGPHSRLSTLALSVELDAFTKVKEAMDKMVAELKAQQEEEVKMKTFCVTEFDANAKMTYKKTEEKEDLEAKIEELAALMKKLAEEIEEAKARIAEAKEATKQAGQDREAENAEYQQVVADQRATQEILTKALKRLQAFYKKKALLQRGSQTPPVQFNKYKKNAGASPVMGLIEQIIEDSKATEASAVKGEADAQAAYETFVKDSNTEIATLEAAIVEKTKAIEGAKVETTVAEGDLQATEAELADLAAYKADLHAQCDFLIKNFTIRQNARLAEIEAIQEAKAILSGMQ